MIENEQLVEVPVVLPRVKLPWTNYRWCAYYWFCGCNGDTFECIGCLSDTPQEAARRANTASTIPGSIRVFEIPKRKEQTE